MKDYVVIDVETTGFDVLEQRIIELAAVRVVDGEISDTFQSFVYSDIPVPYRILQLTGITNGDVLNAPMLKDILPRFIEFINGYEVIGHNVRFDMSFICYNCKKLGIDYNSPFIDTLRISRQLFPQLEHHRLSDVCDLLSVENERAHRALSDCKATNECFLKLCEIADDMGISFADEYDLFELSAPDRNYRVSQSDKLRELHKLILDITSDNILTEDEVFTLKAFLDNNTDLEGQYPFDRASAAIRTALEDNIIEPHELEEMLEIFKGLVSPRFSQSETNKIGETELNGKAFCLTGDFATGTKSEIKSKLESLGMCSKSAVSGKLDYLIVGDKGSQAWKCGTYGGKIKKAFELNDAGNNICIIGEKDFLNKLL